MVLFGVVVWLAVFYYCKEGENGYVIYCVDNQDDEWCQCIILLVISFIQNKMKVGLEIKVVLGEVKWRR